VLLGAKFCSYRKAGTLESAPIQGKTKILRLEANEAKAKAGRPQIYVFEAMAWVRVCGHQLRWQF
jgi:hypothetical protein